ncbi:MAG: transmembrane region and signal peptide [Gallionellaceae bacterium]|nr:MAG: transmembrane region and signal peptide [Gallionellaceae bacterium]
MKNGILQGTAAFASLLFPVLAFAAPAQPEVSYKNDVSPIIHDYCLNCHEPKGKGFETSGLDLRTYKSLMKGTKFGTVIKPGDSFTSIMIQVIDGRVHDSIKMPYGMAGGLSKAKIGVLKKWVDQGAKDN